MKNTIIYLLGFPGTGKYTIATEIAALTSARVIDNHLINNPIFSILRTDGKTKLPDEAWDYTIQIGDVVREAIVNLAPPDASFIFTNALRGEDNTSRVVYEKIVRVAMLRNSTFIPVRLLCDLPTLQKRIVTEDRDKRMKMTDARGIAENYNKFTIFIPAHPHRFDLDVSNLEASQAAQLILRHVETLSP